MGVEIERAFFLPLVKRLRTQPETLDVKRMPDQRALTLGGYAGRLSERAIGAEKQITQSLPHPQRNPPSMPVLVAVMEHMAALAKSPEVSKMVVGWVVVQMRRRQKDLSRADGLRADCDAT